ncbi:D-xylose transport system substrate-binding protein [Natronobacillus azotifigens]|uniref:Substrate-binding domain-containing protein n=1 Tax=Natronobacillus azotifigens TaxID=472978 RepID=A0A9J6RCT1_9BACI|nr:substrate-binding domain-containing protein [Natronobacillus azotifigens]MCZ0703163.1 substrate-binding domain-containing protein [Natronobacillus azotifigens]
MKRITFLLFASLIATVFLLGCEENTKPNDWTDQSEVDPEASTDEKRQITIGLSMDTLIEERWERDRDMFKEAVEAQGAEVVVKAANGNDALQIAQAETMISQGVDLLVLVPHNAEAAATIVGRAQLADIPVISYDRLVKNANVDLYISFDNEQVGVLQAEAMIDVVPQGKYAYIGGASTDNNAHLIKEGVFRVLQPLIDRGDIVVVYDQWTEAWMPMHAKENMRAALAANDNEIDAVIAANDATAGAVIEALTEVGLNGQVPVAGQDAELLGVQRVLSGEQLMTVYKSIRSLTEQAADIAVRMAKGEVIETDIKVNNGKKDVPTLFLTPVTVNADNIETTVIEDGFHTHEDIFE